MKAKMELNYMQSQWYNYVKTEHISYGFTNAGEDTSVLVL